jgi:DNA-3-methyladenine glycosylase
VPDRPLASAFYARPTLIVARELIGALLVHETRAGRLVGRVVEVEAYVGESDPACHAAPGPTARNAPLYGPPGVAYVYLNYGMHCLLNAVTEDEGRPAAILLRAVEPLEGLPHMRRRRTPSGGRLLPDWQLGRGPGNLTRAFDIGLSQNRTPLTGGALTICAGPSHRVEVRWTRRIGLSVGNERYWRCIAAGSQAVTGTRPWNADARRGPHPARATADRRLTDRG